MDIFLARCDGWAALYLDGKCVQQGHSVSSSDLLERIQGQTIGKTETVWVEEESATATGRFPSTLEELKKHLKTDDKEQSQ